jgi:hypothetical protein
MVLSFAQNHCFSLAYHEGKFKITKSKLNNAYAQMYNHSAKINKTTARVK